MPLWYFRAAYHRGRRPLFYYVCRSNRGKADPV